ncbi:MAG: hypothetical protein H7175_15335 [Burkholderiales bacterium]|nr:hypothetical protein [Anaerolineae bacterium]
MPNMVRRCWLWLTMFGTMWLAACGNPSAPNTTQTTLPTETLFSRYVTIAAPVQRATLPPIWTPAHTNTPVTPPPTRTPTDTPPPSPTRTADDLCAGFSAEIGFEDGHLFAADSTIALIVISDAPDSSVIFYAEHHRSGDNRSVEMPGGQMIGMELDAAVLPHSGRYDWRLYLDSPVYGEICERSGYFIVLGAAAESTAEP